MDLKIGLLEKHWPVYEKWCKDQGFVADFGNFLIWLDDYDIDIGQEQAEYESI